MIEQTIEKRIIDRLQSALADVGVERYFVTGRLVPSENAVKGIENGDNDVIVVVRTQPRQYSTPTIPTCQLNFDINVLVRADTDYSGKTYLDVTDAIMGVLQHWQKCYRDTHDEFTIEGEFQCAGFQLGSGTFGLDQTGKVWNYTHTLAVFGVVADIDHTTN